MHAVVVLLLVGCGSVTEDNFAAERAAAECQVKRRCFRAEYEGEFDGSLEECEEELTTQFESEAKELYEDCDFEEENAVECINAIRTATCGEFWDSSEEIFEDCQVVFSCD